MGWRRKREGEREQVAMLLQLTNQDQHHPYIIINCIIVNLPELIDVVVQLYFLQHTVHHRDKNILVSEESRIAQVIVLKSTCYEDRNDGCAVHFATVCALRTERCMVVGYVPRELSCKCSLWGIQS